MSAIGSNKGTQQHQRIIDLTQNSLLCLVGIMSGVDSLLGVVPGNLSFVCGSVSSSYTGTAGVQTSVLLMYHSRDGVSMSRRSSCLYSQSVHKSHTNHIQYVLCIPRSSKSHTTGIIKENHIASRPRIGVCLPCKWGIIVHAVPYTGRLGLQAKSHAFSNEELHGHLSDATMCIIKISAGHRNPSL